MNFEVEVATDAQLVAPCLVATATGTLATASALAQMTDADSAPLRGAMTISTSWVKHVEELTQDAFHVPLMPADAMKALGMIQPFAMWEYANDLTNVQRFIIQTHKSNMMSQAGYFQKIMNSDCDAILKNYLRICES